MNKQKKYYFYYWLFFFSVLILSQNHLSGQNITKSYAIPKFNIRQTEENDRLIKWLTFEKAIALNEYPMLPAFWDKIEVNHLYASYHYTVLNAKYEALTSDESALIPKEYVWSEPQVHISTTTDKNRFYAMLSIIPVVKNASGQYQKLVSCDIRFEGIEPIRMAKSAGLRNSVLEKGTWYKIAVTNTGLHKVTYKDLENLKIPLSELRSANIALYGNGGGMIANVNPVEQQDDLLPVPIMIKDNGNGNFDANSYFVFYAQGPHSWEYNASTDVFTHKNNVYSDSAYYFINVDAGIGEKKQIEKKNFLNQTTNKSATGFTYYDFYEKDVKNFGESGREWFDDVFSVSNSKTYNFVIPEPISNTGRIKIRVAGISTATSTMKLTWNGFSKDFQIKGNNSTNYASDTMFEENNTTFTSGNFAPTLTYTSAQSSASAHLDYIEIQTKCKLNISGDAMPFAITENTGAANFTLVNLNNASGATVVWDVTDHNAVYEVVGKLTGSQFTFHTPTDKPRCFVAFNGNKYQSVTPVGKVANQNLHNFKGVDMVIVSHSNFLQEANRLAQFRAKANGITVKVVTPEQVYNEFSSGAQDPTAIRNFMRYLYDNDAQTIKYLLLFGRPSYDYRGRVTGTQLFVPNWQDVFSLSESSFAGDDYFGVLGVNEGNMNKNTINIAVGRFPVTTSTEAKIVVEKTINASERHKIVVQNAAQVPNFGDWRNIITLVADDKDDALFVKHAESAANVIINNYPAFNLDKIYSDAFPVVSYAGGQRYPEVNKAINRRMEKGTLAITYMGHGGGNGWAHERILELVDINGWRNKYNQPLMVTVTCSFGWYDKKAVSPAERAFLNDKGGVSAIITTSRISFANEDYGNSILYEIGKKWNNRYQTVGEIQKNAKNNNNGSTNMIYLMGDPAMYINVPHYNVKTDEILNEDLQKLDTLKALSKVIIKGSITDDEGKILENFNGNLYPSIFDKAVKQKTLGQDAPVMEFMVQKNIVFKGNVTVKNGHFEFSFYVPKDINFEYGKGKISYYAASENEDAGDYYDNIIIGGMSHKPVIDKTGPDISIFLNDEKFVSGSITNPNPMLLLKLKDEYGINTTGNGIGHDLVAILDDNTEKQMILNDYYLADQDSYNSGTVRYPLYDLAPGAHTLKVRAWDIFNNPSEASIEFIVKSDKKLILDHVLNYPNPFTTKTEFRFEHNQPGETFDILIHIFTISGKLVKTIQETRFVEGNVCNKIFWDGRDEYGDKIGKGVYIYRLTVRNSQNDTVEKIEKIAIL